MSNWTKPFRAAPPPSSERREFVETLRAQFERGSLELAVSPDVIPDALMHDLFGTYPRVGKHARIYTVYAALPLEGLIVCVQPWCFERISNADSPEAYLQPALEAKREPRNDGR
jgi:hypothetical protein